MDAVGRYQQGFTLVELVMVMVIAAVLAAYAMASWSPSDSSVHAQSSHMARDIRHAQMLAMQLGAPVSVRLTGSTGYRITDTGGTTLNDPASGDSLSRAYADGVTRSGSCGQIDFDTLGRPYSGGALMSASCTYVLNADRGRSTITMTPVTAYLGVSP